MAGKFILMLLPVLLVLSLVLPVTFIATRCGTANSCQLAVGLRFICHLRRMNTRRMRNCHLIKIVCTASPIAQPHYIYKYLLFLPLLLFNFPFFLACRCATETATTTTTTTRKCSHATRLWLINMHNSDATHLSI